MPSVIRQETNEVKYLKKRYRECPTGEKRIKFSNIENDLISQFPSTSWNSRSVSRAVCPSSESKKHGKNRHIMYVDGIDLNECDPMVNFRRLCTPTITVNCAEESSRAGITTEPDGRTT